MLKVGVFYDGNYLYHVSNYYAFRHYRHARISISGLHYFIRYEISRQEGVGIERCHVVDAHYFRGRYPTHIIEQRGWLKGERLFEDVLMYNGVATHFWPITEDDEHCVKVAFALETLELAKLKQFDVCVLIVGSSDYLPLVRKLNATGAKVMILGWDFEYIDDRGVRRETRVSKSLLSECSYPLILNEVIDLGEDESCSEEYKGIIEKLFVNKGEFCCYCEKEIDVADDHEDCGSDCCCRKSGYVDLDGGYSYDEEEQYSYDEGSRFLGKIVLLNQGWGFIKPESGDPDIFFFYGDLENVAFDQLNQGDSVSYAEGRNERGPIAKCIRVIEDMVEYDRGE